MKSIIDFGSTDCRCSESNRSAFSSSKVEREVVSVTLVHNFHAKTSTVQNICPGVQDFALTIHDGLVEVETVEVECHGANTKSSEPDTDNRPCCEEEVQRTGVVEGSVLEDQATEVTVGSNDVVGLFFLTKLVTIVLRLSFSRLADKRGSNETSVHSREKRSTEYPSNTEHVERMHKDVVLCLENKHVVKGARNTKRHSVTKRTLTERIDQEDCRCGSDGSGVSNTDPRAHTQTIGQFPLTTHVCIDTDQEVEDYELERSTVIQPLVKRCGFPNRVEVKTNCVGRGNNCTRDDVVAVHERTSDWFADAVDIHRRSSDERNDEADGCCQQSWDHQHTEPTDIQTVVGGGYPGTKVFPGGLSPLLDESRLSHCFEQKSKTIREMVELLFLCHP